MAESHPSKTCKHSFILDNPPKIQILLVILLLLIPITGLAACQGNSRPLPSSLQLEEYPLEAPPDADRGIFLPTGTSQQAVLDHHREERNQEVYNNYSQDSILPVIISRGEGEELTAELRASAEDPHRMTADLLRGDDVIFTTDAGLPSPALPLQGLWTYDDHWVLEILLAEGEIWQGQLFQDGQLINDLRNYQEAFGFQLLAGKPFYFYQREGKLGYSYDGQENNLPYNQILHYGCCSASSLNPIPAKNMVAFYALTGEAWFYVELGAFGKENGAAR